VVGALTFQMSISLEELPSIPSDVLSKIRRSVHVAVAGVLGALETNIRVEASVSTDGGVRRRLSMEDSVSHLHVNGSFTHNHWSLAPRAWSGGGEQRRLAGSVVLLEVVVSNATQGALSLLGSTAGHALLDEKFRSELDQQGVQVAELGIVLGPIEDLLANDDDEIASPSEFGSLKDPSGGSSSLASGVMLVAPVLFLASMGACLMRCFAAWGRRGGYQTKIAPERWAETKKVPQGIEFQIGGHVHKAKVVGTWVATDEPHSPSGMTHQLEYKGGVKEWVKLDQGRQLLSDQCGNRNVPYRTDSPTQPGSVSTPSSRRFRGPASKVAQAFEADEPVEISTDSLDKSAPSTPTTPSTKGFTSTASSFRRSRQSPLSRDVGKDGPTDAWVAEGTAAQRREQASRRRPPADVSPASRFRPASSGSGRPPGSGTPTGQSEASTAAGPPWTRHRSSSSRAGRSHVAGVPSDGGP